MLTDVTTLAALRQHHLFAKLPEAAFQEVCNLAISRKLESGVTSFSIRATRPSASIYCCTGRSS